MERRFGKMEGAQLSWNAPPARWRLCDNELHCWAASLEVAPEQTENLAKLLSSDERERAARFRVERSRGEFVVTRGVLRLLLSGYTKIPAVDLVFLYGPNGKPALAPWMSHGVQFNVSHSGQVALYAVAAKHEVGVDVEQIASIPEAMEIAKRFFPKQEAAGRAMGEAHVSKEFFFRSWTRSEAVLKCSGEGITDDPESRVDLSNALVCELEPAPGYVGAVAVNSPTPLCLRTWRWE